MPRQAEENCNKGGIMKQIVAAPWLGVILWLAAIGQSAILFGNYRFDAHSALLAQELGQ